MILYCATTNKGKVREFRLAAPTGIAIEPLPGLAAIPAPDETGDTFEANAALKANYYSLHLPGQLVFADDSGLTVDALDGAPGVHSARYAGQGAGTDSNNALLLERMAGRANRAARFLCVIALSRDGQLIAAFRGTIEGEIISERRGTGGFGYDPLFHSPELGCTLAEASEEAKLRVSHRGAAVRKLLAYLAANSPAMS